jgi:excinuclease UvrABC nuclease subunit
MLGGMMEEIARFASVRFGLRPSGVYLLLWQGEVVYVGKSTNVFMRIGHHYHTTQRARKRKHEWRPWDRTPAFDEVRVKAVPVERLDAEEFALINQYRPKGNTLLKREMPKIDLSDSPIFARLRAQRKEQPRTERSKIKTLRRRVLDEVRKAA